MALSPSIPTSFVPKQPVSTGNKRYTSGSNILLIISLIIFGASLLAAAGIFIYVQYLHGVEKSKGAQLIQAQNSVNEDTVNGFIKLENRLSSAKTLINQHVELSQFFTALEGVTLQTVHYDSLTLQVASDRSATIQLKGTAKDFNSLAAQSTAFASQKYIKSAIFTGIDVNKTGGGVAFEIDATLDPAIVVEHTAPTTPVVLPAAAVTTATAGTTTTP